MGKHLVLAGGGHAHLTTLKNLRTYVDAGHQVTVVNTSSYQYYSGMGPGMLSGTYRPQEIRFNVRRMAENGGAVFVEDTVTHIDPGGRRLLLGSGNTLAYDVASFNTGSYVPTGGLDTEAENIVTVKPIINLLRVREQVLSGSGQLDVAVVGGGPAGVEIAGNLIDTLNESGRLGSVSIVSDKTLLKGFPQRTRDLTHKTLKQKGVNFYQDTNVTSIKEGTLFTSDGSRLKAGLVVLATGVRPSMIFEKSGLPTGPDGGMLVNHYLQSTAYPELFGGGDCISLKGMPLAKVGVYAVRQNPVLCHNLLAALNGTPLELFQPEGKYLQVFNLGTNRGVLNRGPLTLHGRLAFTLKDYIDRRFMQKFQISGELTEPPGPLHGNI